MKKIFTLMLFSLILSGCGSNVDRVKNGTMTFNKTTTLGKALDNWDSCKTSKWSERETSSGIQIVEFQCIHNIDLFMVKLRSVLKEYQMMDDNLSVHLNLVSFTQRFEFTLNKDKTFQLNNVNLEFVWKEGAETKIFSVNSEDPIEVLKSAYDNDPIFSFSSVTEVPPQEALQFRDFFLALKSQAK